MTTVTPPAERMFRTQTHKRNIILAVVIATALAFGLVLATANTVAAAAMVMVKEKANIRKGPGLKFKVLWTAYKYYPLEVIGKRGRWLKVRDFEGDIGWVARSIVAESPAVVVKVKMANIRAKSSTKSSVSIQAKRGVAFKLLRRKGKWLQVEHEDGEKGWIFYTLVWGKQQ